MSTDNLARRKPRGRMPAKVKVTVRFVPADFATTWKPLVDEARARVEAQRGKRQLQEGGAHEQH